MIKWRAFKLPLRELQAFFGTPNFACRVVPPGRPFLQRMIALTRKVSQSHNHIKLNSGVFKDLNIWQEFISGWNGVGFFLPTTWVNSDSLQLYTDASGSIGFGGIFATQWFQGQWRGHQHLWQPGISIAWQELFALVVACHLWGSTFGQPHWGKKKPNCWLAFSLSGGKISHSGPTRRPSPQSNITVTLGDLDADINHYLNLSIAASTEQTYSSAEKGFLDFCSLYRPTSGRYLPTVEDTLTQYAAFLARSIKYSSIKGYLAAVRHLHIRRDFTLGLNKCLRLQLVCRGFSIVC